MNHINVAAIKKTNVRWIVVAVLFFITIINYADRATISLAGPAIAKELKMDSISMGYIFSAFGWSYVVCQLPGGYLLDRFGSKKVYAFSIFFWSLFTLFQGFIGFLAAGTAVMTLFALRFMVALLRHLLSQQIAGLLPRGSRRQSVVLHQLFSIQLNMLLPYFSHHSWAG